MTQFSKFDSLLRSGPVKSTRKAHHSSMSILWHSQEFGRQLPQITNLSVLVQDAIKFSSKLESPLGNWSLWNWQPLRALAHMAHQRFDFVLSLQIQSIKGLPLAFNGMRIVIRWRRKERSVHTKPVTVHQGEAKFEQTLNLLCGVYASKHPPHRIKYFPIYCNLSCVLLDRGTLILGKHKLDVGRVLPKTIDQTARNGGALCGWSLSFKLSRKANEASVVATVGFKLQKKPGRKQKSVGQRLMESSLTYPLCSSIAPHASVQETVCDDPSLSRMCSSRESVPLSSISAMAPVYDLSFSKTELTIADNTEVYASTTTEGFGDHSQFDRSSSALAEGDEESAAFAGFVHLENIAIEEFKMNEHKGFAEKRVDYLKKVDMSTSQSALRMRWENLQTSLRGDERLVQVDTSYERSVKEEGACNWMDMATSSSRDVWFNEEAALDGSCDKRQNYQDHNWQKKEAELPKPLTSIIYNAAIPMRDLQGVSDGKAGMDNHEFAYKSKQCEQEEKILLNLDDEAELIASQFLQMLEDDSTLDGSASESKDHDRAIIFKPIKGDCLVKDIHSENLELKSKWQMVSESNNHEKGTPGNGKQDSISIFSAPELQRAPQITNTEVRAKIHGDSETDALMQQWIAAEKDIDRLLQPMSNCSSILLPMSSNWSSNVAAVDKGSFRSTYSRLICPEQRSPKPMHQVCVLLVPAAEIVHSPVGISDILSCQAVSKIADQTKLGMPLKEFGGKIV